ncbi:hypothetical protein [Hymenobacter seoulensis]
MVKILPLLRRPPHVVFAPSLLLDLAFLVVVSLILLLSVQDRPKQTVMEIAMPLRPRPRSFQESKLSLRFEVPPPATLRRMRLWHTTALTGETYNDSLNLLLFRDQLKHMMQFPDNTNGVSIRFGPYATYGRLIDVLDELNQLEVKKYFIDHYSPVIAVYALTDSWQRPALASELEPSPIQAPERTAPDSASSATSQWADRVVQPLHHSAWGTALLACLGVAAVCGVVWLSTAFD